MTDFKTMRAQLAGLSQRQPERAAEIRRDYRVAKCEQYIRDLIEMTPPPTPAQRDRLCRLLREGK